LLSESDIYSDSTPIEWASYSHSPPRPPVPIDPGDRIASGVLWAFVGAAIGGLLGWIPAGGALLIIAFSSIFTRWTFSNADADITFPTLWVLTALITTALGFMKGYKKKR
jgi:hypothetical protein